MNIFTPLTPLSVQLLSSIPRKVQAWLSFISVELNDGNFDDLNWNFGESSGWLSTVMDGRTVMITWENTEDASVGCTDQLVEDLEDELPWFVELEKNIYDQIEAMAEYLAIKRELMLVDFQDKDFEPMEDGE